MLERPARNKRSAAAERRRAATDPTHAARNRRSRRRQRQGMIWLGIEATEHPLAEALIASGRLTDAEALDRKRVGAAVEGIVADFIARWVRGAI